MKLGIKIILITLIVITALSSVLILIGTVVLFRYKDSQVDPHLIELTLSHSPTQFFSYSREDRELRKGSPKLIENAALCDDVKYIFVPISDIPDDLINAFIAIEDKRFYSHNGIDLKRTAHAVVNYIFGKEKFGGSTITQQLIKNITGNSALTLERKFSEAFSAIALEKKYDKSQILEAYLNIINLAEGCKGVGAAAEHYYSKTPQELSLDQCASIAAITNNPSKYDPEKHPENNKIRRDMILKSMLEQDYISDDEYRNAVNSPINLNISEKSANTKINSWYIDMVIEDVISDLSKNMGITPKSASFLVYSGGLNIYTAIDEEIQNILDEYYSNVYKFPLDNEGNMPQSSMIIIDPYNGDILAVAGAVGKKNGNRIQNFATITKRPVGSAIKPLSVYAPAIERGLINWGTVIEDSPTTFQSSGEPWPKNSDRQYHGNVNIKFAVEHSLNTVAVKVLETVGNDSSFNFLKDKLKIYNLDPQNDKGSASLALGQMSKGITLRELTSAYSIFENGIMSKSRSYFKVTDSQGNIILDNRNEQERVISCESAAVMTKMLQTVVESGTAKEGITLDEKTEVAGKSGTSGNNCDRYFVGYTPELLAGVWLGYEYPKSLEEFGGNLSVYIWDEVMQLILSKTNYGKNKSFNIPDTVQKITINKATGCIPAKDDDMSLIEDGWFNIYDRKKS